MGVHIKYPLEAIALLRGYAADKSKTLRLPSSGNSMYPFLASGDTLTIKPAAIAKISIGDMIVFSHEGMLFCHRVIAKRLFTPQGPMVITKSDVRGSADPAIGQDELLGKVSEIQKNKTRRTIRLEREPWILLNRFLGFSHLSMYALWRALKPLKNLITLFFAMS